MKTNNKGFTLAELLVSVAIFGVVLAAAFGFMLTSAKSYNKVNDRLEIQTQSQMALNLIEEYVIDCAGGFLVDSSTYDIDVDDEETITYFCDTLYVLGAPAVSENDKTTTCNVIVFRLDTASGVLQYGEDATATLTKTDETNGTSTYECSVDASSTKFYAVTDKVVSFNVTKNEINGKTVSSAISLEMKNRSADYLETKNIALRNRPATITLS